MLTAVAAINESIENGNSTQLIDRMNNHNAGLTSVDESYCNRYLAHFISVKEEKAQVSLKFFTSCCLVNYRCRKSCEVDYFVQFKLS